MNTLQFAILLFSALSACYRVNASPTRLSYIAQAISGSTCASAGHTNGCCVSAQSQQADCYVSGGECYCDVGCHQYGDCCSDISDIQCFNPRTCESLGFSPGCCSLASSSCYVPDATCYCDPTCHANGDCCMDVTLTQCPVRAQRMRASTERISLRTQKARPLRVRQQQSEVAHKGTTYRDAVANRLLQNTQG